MLQRVVISVVIVFAAMGVGRADAPAAAPAIVQQIQKDLAGPPSEDLKPHPGVPRGQYIDGAITDSKIYPGTVNQFRVYVPAQYNPDKPTCLLVKLDGIGGGEGTILDNLIAKGEMPVTIAVGIFPEIAGKVAGRATNRWGRSAEFDSMSEDFPNYVLDELLPRVESLRTKDGRPIRISANPNDRAATGASSGGIGAFTLAWERPDAFSRVYSMIGTFVSMRGGNEYPVLVRKTEPKAIRVFLEDGSADAWNPLFGNWFSANQEMAAALTFAGYDVQHAWGTHGHDARPGNVAFPDVMRWLWRGWPAPIQVGQSSNNMLAAILLPDEGWKMVGSGYKAAAGLASDQMGDVYFSDPPDHVIYKVGTDGRPSVFVRTTQAITGEAFGPDGTLYAVAPADQQIIAIGRDGRMRTIATGIRGHGIVVTSDNAIYVSEPGAHSDDPSELWLVEPTGNKRIVDRGLSSASGIAFSPDKELLYGAEASTRSVYSYVAEPDGTLQDRQRFYRLQATDFPDNSGAEDMVVDHRGMLYVATRMGIQVGDQNGSVRAIIPLPIPYGTVRSMSWGGVGFDTLYATDGHKVFKRRFKAQGYAQWAAPTPPVPWTSGAR